jgi:ankyrin repeat protein
LHYAAGYGYPEIIDLLMLAGADANTMNSWNINPITVAVLKSNQGTVNKLLEFP